MCVCIHTHSHTYIHMCVYTHICVCTHTYIHMCVYTHIHTYVYVHTHTYICVCTHTHMYVCVYTHIYIYCKRPWVERAWPISKKLPPKQKHFNVTRLKKTNSLPARGPGSPGRKVILNFCFFPHKNHLQEGLEAPGEKCKKKKRHQNLMPARGPGSGQRKAIFELTLHRLPTEPGAVYAGDGGLHEPSSLRLGAGTGWRAEVACARGRRKMGRESARERERERGRAGETMRRQKARFILLC